MLADAGFELDDVFYSNAVRCGGKPPTPSEIDACRPWLAADIAEVQPQAIIALGDPALRALTKLSGLQTKRGSSYKLHASLSPHTSEEIVWPTYSPAYVAMYPQARHTVVADLRRVRDRTKQAEEIPWEWWDGAALPPGPYGFDIETDWDRKTKTGGDNMIQCAVAVSNRVFVAYGPEQAKLLAQQLTGEVYTLNGWKFDNPKCRALGIAVPHGVDVMGMAYLDDETQPLGLESLAVKYLGVRGWKDLRDAEPGTDEFALYNAKDSYYTLLLALKLRNVLGKRTALITHVMSPARLALDACTERGVPLNAGAIQRARDSYVAALHSEHDEVIQLACASGYTEHNPNSTAEVGAILTARGIHLSHTPSGKLATGKGVLQEAGGDAYAAALLSYREARKALSTYVEPYERAIQSTGRVHPEYTIWRTVTNRTSARNPNVQNLPRNLKDFFNVTSVDYSAIEFRLAAWCAGETGILRRFAENPAWDPHRYFAALFYNKPESEVTKSERQVAKSANFSQLYMGNGDTLQAYAGKMGIVLDSRTCHDIHHRWHATFPAFRHFYQQTLVELMECGYVETATGYRRHYGDFRALPPIRRTAALRECVNVKVQTLAAHVALIGLAECHRQGLPVCGFIHDANLFDFKTKREALDAMPLIEYCMITHPVKVLREHFNVNLDVPLIVEATFAA
jgi:DNA polymerase I-like protein with 3'-5' exonuclease and polymerase domains